MTLENMREIGVRSIEVACECGHEAIIDVEALVRHHSAPSGPITIRRPFRIARHREGNSFN